LIALCSKVGWGYLCMY